MVFMVPDGDDPLGAANPLGGGSQEEKARLDERNLDESDEVPRALQKVELDLDDAPFLEEEEDEPEEDISAEEALAQAAPAEKKRVIAVPAWLTKKFLFFAAGGLALLLAAILAIVLWPEKTPEPDEPAEQPIKEAEKPASEAVDLNVTFDPFWIELIDKDGKVRFLHLQFTIVATNKLAEGEISAKTFQLRDAVYYYVKNKEFAFLADTENLETLKSDILSVLNKFVAHDNIETILIDKYLVQ